MDAQAMKLFSDDSLRTRGNPKSKQKLLRGEPAVSAFKRNRVHEVPAIGPWVELSAM
jgi:hypothetical protein